MSFEPAEFDSADDTTGSTRTQVVAGEVREVGHTPRLRPEPALAAAPRNPTRFSSLLRLHGYLRPYAIRWATMVVSSVLSTAAAIIIPLVTKAVVDGPIAHHDQRGLWTLGVLAVALGVLEATLWFVRRFVVARATNGVEAAIRMDLYAHLQRLSMAFHGRWQSGQLLSRIMNDLATVRRFLAFGLLFLILNVLQIVVVTVILLQMYWPLGLVVLASAVPIILLVLKNERVYTRLSRTVQDQTGDVATSVEEAAHGIRVIKAFGRGEHVYARFDEKALALYDTTVQKVRISARFWTFLEIIPTVALIVVLGFGTIAAGQGRLTLGSLVAFITLMLSLVWPIASLGFILSMTQEAMTAADRICEVLDTVPDIPDGSRQLLRPVGLVRLEHVCFRFPDAEPGPGSEVLRGVNLLIEPGQTVALVGTTGAGKTVLTSLIARLYDVTGGRITIDGHDVRDLTLASLRTVVATAFEDPTLFSMSVRENLTLGRADASDEDVLQAIDVAQAGFVHELPWGLDTRIGEQGMSLSGGQRQRLALARAVLARPAVLVLDDTLSALDVHTEALVEAALKRVLANVTGLVVAHRASTVLLADRVALLQHGTITHVGTHTELLATVPAYRDLLAAPDELDEGTCDEPGQLRDADSEYDPQTAEQRREIDRGRDNQRSQEGRGSGDRLTEGSDRQEVAT